MTNQTNSTIDPDTTDKLGSTDNSDFYGLDNLAAVVIVAGGESKRMGSAKAQLSLPSNERLLDYHVRHASQLGVPIMIADNERGFTVDQALLLDPSTAPLLHIKDYRPTIETADSKPAGALAAIASAMQVLTELGGNRALSANESQASSTPEWLMVLSCDSLITATDLWQVLQPVLTRNTAKAKAQNLSPDDSQKQSVICLADADIPYPLLGVYHLAVYPELINYLDRGERRVIKFIEPLYELLPLPLEWQQLANLNTPDDFKTACAQLSF
ncbi:molybdenum cofactor guanylyltransferase [Psychrobacter pygoscelis]|uniref:molybdenum cofactor guanylyltransferase n=1 Tax=Psychrobacter pygoscelis TaxID=2488563 RepID=UPI00103A2F4E|nr:NTP transferase domain-containing protein [Psychrobacter pygoscelis]